MDGKDPGSRRRKAMSEQESQPDVTGETVLEAQFDRKIGPHTRWTVSGWLVVSIVGIPLIPFWLLFSLWYVPEYLRRISARLTTQALEVRKGVFFSSTGSSEATIPLLFNVPEYLRRISARLTTQALEVRKGVFFRSEATIPLNRITDVRLHDGPLMRHYGLRGLKVETAGQSGDTGSEGNIYRCDRRGRVPQRGAPAAPGGAGLRAGRRLPEYGRRSRRAPDGDPRHPGANRSAGEGPVVSVHSRVPATLRRLPGVWKPCTCMKRA